MGRITSSAIFVPKPRVRSRSVGTPGMSGPRQRPGKMVTAGQLGGWCLGKVGKDRLNYALSWNLAALFLVLGASAVLNAYPQQAPRGLVICWLGPTPARRLHAAKCAEILPPQGGGWGVNTPPACLHHRGVVQPSSESNLPEYMRSFH